MHWSTGALACLILSACALDAPPSTPTEVRDDLPVAQAPPSFAILFSGGEKLTSGQTSTFQLSGAPPGAPVYLFASQLGPGAGPCAPGGALCLDLSRPFRVAAGQADAQGLSTLQLRVPPTLPSSPVFLQAASAGAAGAGKSSVLLVIPDDADGDLIPDAQDVCPDVPDPYQVDQDDDGWGAACDCDDTDDRAAPGGVDTSLDGVDQDCDERDGTQPVCPLTAPVRCPDGTCRSSATACATTCPVDAPYACTDGSCGASWSACAPTCQDQTPVTCPDGSCAVDVSSCAASCPQTTPVLCSNGDCARNSADCPQSCPAASPMRCPDGSCRASADACVATGCPAAQPIRCPDASCATTLAACAPACSARAPVTCANGSCATDVQACSTTCSGQAPYLCPDGTCATSALACAVLCPAATPVRCADGACYADATCQVPACPTSRPVRCADGSCAVAVGQCAP